MDELLRHISIKMWCLAKEKADGQAMVEYSLILVIVVVVCIGIVTQIGDTLKTGFYDAIAELPL